MAVKPSQCRKVYHDAMATRPFEPIVSAEYDEIFRFARFPHMLKNGNQKGRHSPSGKRRDQSTAEIFGTENEKDLQAMPKTFHPKYENLSAHERKQHFLSSATKDVVPHSIYENVSPPLVTSTAPRIVTQKRNKSDRRGGTVLPKFPGKPGAVGSIWDVHSHEDVTAKMRKQMEHSTELEGWSETPSPDYDHVHDVRRRYVPLHYNWWSIPEELHHPEGEYAKMNHKERYFTEKSSHAARELLEGASNRNAGHMTSFQINEWQEKHEEAVEECKRRNDVAFYSNVFWTEDNTGAMPVRPTWRPKTTCSPEERITGLSDWTNSHTEIHLGSRNGGGCNNESLSQTPRGRKNMELNRSRVWNEKQLGPANENLGKYRGEAFMTDNASKMKRDPVVETHSRMATQDVHQMSLRSSGADSEFYSKAHESNDWQVVEVHVTGIDPNWKRHDIRTLCGGFNLHIVNVCLDWNPVVNVNKGRARIQIRYNPQLETHALENLLHKLDSHSLNVIV